ncbi:hypothetical protein ACHAXR_003552 [Thalassiosira sp. AJA248-18]
MIAKRNKKGRKMHEEEALANKESWDNLQINQDIDDIIKRWGRLGRNRITCTAAITSRLLAAGY